MADEPVTEITDPALEGVPDEAFQIDGDSLTPDQLAVRLHLKREQAMQDAGWTAPPGPDEELEPVEDEAPVVDEDDPRSGDSSVEEPEEEPEEEPGEPEEEPEEEPEVPEDEVDDEFFLARYRDRESAEEGLAEKDRTIAALYRQLHEREQALEQQQVQQPEQLDLEAWSQWAAEAVDGGAGIRGANQALEAGGAQGFDIYMAHWQAVEDPEERVQAMAFNNEVQRQFAEQRALAAIQPEIDKSHERTVEEEAQTAKQLVATRHPDFVDYQEEMDRLIVDPSSPLDEETKQWLAGVAQEGIEGKVRAWDYLYLAARASRIPRRQEAQRVEKVRRTKDSDAAKIAATVSTAEGSGAHTPPSAAESAILQRRNAIREKLGQPLLDES